MDYKDKSKKEAVWDKFCEENNLDKDACQRWFQSQRTLFGKVTHMKSGQGEPLMTERQKWTRDNSDFLRDHIVHHLTAKSEFRAPKGSASQASAAAASSSRWETVHTQPFQDTVVKKFVDDKPDNIRLGFCDFLLEVVQLTSDSYDEFQQETFNLT